MPTDNHATIIPAIAKYLLGLSPEGITERDRKRLERTVAGEHDYILVEFVRGSEREARCDLAVRLWRNNTERSLDEAGNLWAEFDVITEVSWQSFGSTAPALAQRRIDLMQAVTHIATAIEREFGTKANALVATKEQREANAVAAAAADVLRRATKVVEAHRKGLRMHQTALLTPEEGQAFGELPVPSQHDVTIDDRRYLLSLGEPPTHPQDGHATFVRRVA